MKDHRLSQGRSRSFEGKPSLEAPSKAPFRIVDTVTRKRFPMGILVQRAGDQASRDDHEDRYYSNLGGFHSTTSRKAAQRLEYSGQFDPYKREGEGAVGLGTYAEPDPRRSQYSQAGAYKAALSPGYRDLDACSARSPNEVMAPSSSRQQRRMPLDSIPPEALTPFHNPMESARKRKDPFWNTLARDHPVVLASGAKSMRPVTNLRRKRRVVQTQKQSIEYLVCPKWEKVCNWDGMNTRKQSLTFQQSDTIVSSSQEDPDSVGLELRPRTNMFRNRASPVHLIRNNRFNGGFTRTARTDQDAFPVSSSMRYTPLTKEEEIVWIKPRRQMRCPSGNREVEETTPTSSAHLRTSSF